MSVKEALILNRRCIRHPERGGAEVYTYHLARALVEQGARVEWFSSKPGGIKSEEEIDGIRFIRKGNEFTTHFYGFLYALKNRDRLIIDEFNGIGFFTFYMKNSIVLIHQLYNEFWTAELGISGYPLKFAEKLLLWMYRNKPAITVSISTFNDLRDIGFQDIKIIHNGLDIEPLENVTEKGHRLTFVYLGRLKKTKRPEDAIRAFMLIQQKIPDAELIIIGDGPLFYELKTKYCNMKGIKFLGYLDDKNKYEVLKKAHFLLVPSIREGWGQVVIQANAMGVPAIGYDVAGLRDSILDSKTGMLAKDFKEMSSNAIKLWQDRERYKAMCKNSINWAKKFSWEKTKKDFLSYLSGRGFN
jgi:glycosyltransferase involved in cell wall biosynthesis